MGKKDQKNPKAQKKKPAGQIALVGNSDPCCIPGCCGG